jgi:hypothetical protein
VAIQAVLAAIVAIGVVNFGGATSPSTSAALNYGRTVVTRHGIRYEGP